MIGVLPPAAVAVKLVGWPSGVEGLERLLRVTRVVSSIQKNVVLARLPQSDRVAEHKDIDVWWRGMQHNGDLMLLLAHLLNLNPEWRQARMTLRTIVDSADQKASQAIKLTDLAHEARIEATTDVIVRAPEVSIQQTMHEASRKADIVFLGLPICEAGEEREHAERLIEMASGFHAVVMVRNNSRFAGKLI